VPLGGGVGERADYLQRIAPILREQIAAQQLTDVYEKIDLPLAPVLAEMERAGVRVDPKALETMSKAMEKEVRPAGEGDLGTGGIRIQCEFSYATG